MRKPGKKWLIAALATGLVVWWCTASPEKKEHLFLHTGNASRAEFIDFLYAYAKLQRLCLLWAGGYEVEGAGRRYEKFAQPPGFEVALEREYGKKFGYILASEHPAQPVIRVTINYGKEFTSWRNIGRGFKQAVADQGWRMEQVEEAMATSQ